ncbi:2-c-methyl-d-erythritol 4-phosphate cytidylyltransferase [Nannochloropsis gaditana]|uniref:2-C-methyl-D-erythritol 4-phosphate cytidylyltransferase, chloroplastic n=1 Tax=Nannochloropsis gaditana TaxID=72520 RepID=W7TNV7_9STRA|nr:2-c-methyl-d-erythritol 4-phosphate cytidylyltransferase [Nannochloropsis gaditana]
MTTVHGSSYRFIWFGLEMVSLFIHFTCLLPLLIGTPVTRAFMPRLNGATFLGPSNALSPVNVAHSRNRGIFCMRSNEMITVEGVSVVLLAGGVGKRMKADRPKQFIELLGKPVLLHSLEIFSTLPGVNRIVIVLDKSYRQEFSFLQEEDPRIVFADPGKERQDSVFNGFSQTLPDASVVCIHDSARPLVSQSAVLASLRDGSVHGAAVLGVPMKATVKESADGEFVLRTMNRSRLWEIQTPQVIKPDILSEAFALVTEKGLEVTDDVSMVEQVGRPVKLTMGEYTNIKLTTPEDIGVAEGFLRERAEGKL